MKRNIMRETNATLDALANAAEAEQELTAIEYINSMLDAVPATVAADVKQRVQDWLETGGHGDDHYVKQQARYIALVADAVPSIEDILVNALAEHFTPAQIDDIAYYPDIDTADAYTWRFELDGKEYTLSYTYATSDVELKQK